MKDRVLCIYCLEELDPNLSRCPHCGNQIVRSRNVFSYLQRCERRSLHPSTEYISKRYGISIAQAEQVLNAYSDTNDEEYQFSKLNTLIKEIRVKNLFNYLNYNVRLNENVSIILAPNGFGKTTLFNLVNFVLVPSLETYETYIKGIPFESFEIVLVNDTRISLGQTHYQNDEKEGQIFSFIITRADGETADGTFDFKNIDIDSDDSYDEQKQFSERESLIKEMKDMLSRMDVWSDVFFIRTNRAFADPKNFVYNDKYSRNARAHGIKEPDYFVDPIISCNDDLTSMMKKCKNAYQELIEGVKNTIASDFLRIEVPDLSFTEFKTALKEYRTKVNELVQFGLLSEQDNDSLKVINSISEADYNDMMLGKGAFLSLYVEKYSKTLEPFGDLYSKMETFRSIINERNAGTKKHIEYSLRGIEYYNGEQLIPLDSLSSGEKNDFIMFFDLIFRIRNKSIILIDEPEISLHINWQEKYIDNVLRALKNKSCQIIISTHSPDIISNHDDYISDINIDGQSEGEDLEEEDAD